MSETTGTRIFRATGILGGASIAVILIGFLKNLLAAYYFGTSRHMDTYFLAIVVPDMAQWMSITGLFNFIPLYAQARVKEGEEGALRTAGKLLTFWLSALTFVLLVCFAGAEWFSYLVAPGLEDSARAIYTVQTRMLVFMSLSIGSARILSAVHHARKHFVCPALAEIVFQIASTTYLIVFRELGATALVLGMVFGGFCQLLVSALGLRIQKIRAPASIDIRHPAVRQMVRLSVPLYIGNAGARINSLIMAAFSSTLAAGGLSALRYAYMAIDVLATSIGLSLAKVLLPFLSEQNAEGKHEEIARCANRGFVGTALLVMPASVGLYLLAEPAIVLMFQRGSFDARSTELTVAALRVYAPALFAMSLSRMCTTIYFAKKDTVTPMLIGLMRVALTTLMCWWLVPRLGHLGIATATTVGELVKMAFMMSYLRSEEERRAIVSALRSSARIGVGVAAMAAVVYPLTQLQIIREVMPNPAGYAALGGVVLTGLLVYVVVLSVVSPVDFTYFAGYARRLLPGRFLPKVVSPKAGAVS